MLKTKLICLPLLGALFLSAAANAATTYNVAVDTHTLNGTTGALDFMFNSGVGIFQSATVQISGFSGGTYGGMQSVFGSGVSGGPIPSAISITNVGGQDNEVLDSFHYGNTLTFTLNFSGPAITSPNGADTAGSLFAFSMFGDAAGTVPVLTSDPNGVALTVNLSTQGALSSQIVSPNLQITPEPSSIGLFSLSILLLAAFTLRRRVTNA